MENINTTIGVYSGTEEYKINGVPDSNLEAHIEYNKTMRFGRGLFLNGKCVHQGYLSDEQVTKFEKLFSDSRFVQTKDTQPYH